MIDIGLMTYFLGIEFYNSMKGLLMHQRRFELEILKKFKMEHCNDVITPDGPMLQLSKNEDEKEANQTQYKRLIGSLLYLSNVQPNLAFSVSIASRFMERLNVSYLARIKK